MRFAAWLLGGLMAMAGSSTLLAAGCGGSVDGHPAQVEKGDVALPGDALSAVKRCQELLESMKDPLALGKELPDARPAADEIAIVAEAMEAIAKKSYAPELSAALGRKGREVAVEARNLAKYLREGDAKTARVVHKGLERLCVRMRNDLPK